MNVFSLKVPFQSISSFFKRKPVHFSFLIVILIGNAFFLNYNAFRVFNLHDMGAYLDASWRVLSGQKMYIDFLFPEGPMHIYMNVFFFKLFGFGKAAILANLITVHSIVICLVFFMVRSRLPFYLTALVTMLTVPSFYWPLSHPWHDQNAHLWGLLAVALIVWQQPFKKKSQVFWTAFVAVILCFISMLCKTNIGGAYGLVFGILFLSSRYRLNGMLGMVAGVVAGAIVSVLLIQHPAEFWEQARQGQNVFGRFAKLRHLKVYFYNYYWLPFIIVLGNVFFVRGTHLIYRVLFFGITFIGLFSCITGGMRSLANIVLWGVQIAFAFLFLYGSKEAYQQYWHKRLWKTTQIVLLIISIFLIGMAVYAGLNLKAWYRLSGRDDHVYYPLKAEAFKGWLFHPWEGKSVDLMVQIMDKVVPPEDTVLNVSDLYIVNALSGRDSYRNIIYAFYSTILPAPGEQSELVRNAILDNPPDWILMHRYSFEYEFKRLNLVEEVQAAYKPVIHFGPYLLLKKKGGD